MIVIYHAGALLAAAGVATKAPEVTDAYARYMAGAHFFMALFAFARHTLGALARSHAAVLAVAGALPLNVIANHACMNGVFGWAGLSVPGAGLALLLVSAGMACWSSSTWLSRPL